MVATRIVFLVLCCCVGFIHGSKVKIKRRSRGIPDFKRDFKILSKAARLLSAVAHAQDLDHENEDRSQEKITKKQAIKGKKQLKPTKVPYTKQNNIKGQINQKTIDKKLQFLRLKALQSSQARRGRKEHYIKGLSQHDKSVPRSFIPSSRKILKRPSKTNTGNVPSNLLKKFPGSATFGGLVSKGKAKTNAVYGNGRSVVGNFRPYQLPARDIYGNTRLYLGYTRKSFIPRSYTNALARNQLYQRRYYSVYPSNVYQAMNPLSMRNLIPAPGMPRGWYLPVTPQISNFQLITEARHFRDWSRKGNVARQTSIMAARRRFEKAREIVLKNTKFVKPQPINGLYGNNLYGNSLLTSRQTVERPLVDKNKSLARKRKLYLGNVRPKFMERTIGPKKLNGISLKPFKIPAISPKRSGNGNKMLLSAHKFPLVKKAPVRLSKSEEMLQSLMSGKVFYLGGNLAGKRIQSLLIHDKINPEEKLAKLKEINSVERQNKEQNANTRVNASKALEKGQSKEVKIKLHNFKTKEKDPMLRLQKLSDELRELNEKRSLRPTGSTTGNLASNHSVAMPALLFGSMLFPPAYARSTVPHTDVKNGAITSRMNPQVRDLTSAQMPQELTAVNQGSARDQQPARTAASQQDSSSAGDYNAYWYSTTPAVVGVTRQTPTATAQAPRTRYRWDDPQEGSDSLLPQQQGVGYYPGNDVTRQQQATAQIPTVVTRMSQQQQQLPTQLTQFQSPRQPTQSRSPQQPTQSQLSQQPTQSQSPQQPTQSRSPQQPTQSQLPQQQTQGQSPQQPTQSQSPQKTAESQSPQQQTQSQLLQQQTQGQLPQQQNQFQLPQQQNQFQSPQQQNQFQSPRQPTQSRSPQQPTQSQLSQQPTQGLSPQQPTQSQSPQQPTQSQSPQKTAESQSPQQQTQSQLSQQQTQGQPPQQPSQNQSPQQPTQSRSPQQPTQSQLPQQQTQGQSPQQPSQNQSPQQPTQSRSPQQLTQSQLSQQPTQSQSPQQPTQSQSPQQPTQSQPPQQPTQSQLPQQQTQGQSPQQPTQSQSPQQPTQSQLPQQQTQGQSPQQRTQSQSPQQTMDQSAQQAQPQSSLSTEPTQNPLSSLQQKTQKDQGINLQSTGNEHTDYIILTRKPTDKVTAAKLLKPSYTPQTSPGRHANYSYYAQIYYDAVNPTTAHTKTTTSQGNSQPTSVNTLKIHNKPEVTSAYVMPTGVPVNSSGDSLLNTFLDSAIEENPAVVDGSKNTGSSTALVSVARQSAGVSPTILVTYGKGDVPTPKQARNGNDSYLQPYNDAPPATPPQLQAQPQSPPPPQPTQPITIQGHTSYSYNNAPGGTVVPEGVQVVEGSNSAVSSALPTTDGSHLLTMINGETTVNPQQALQPNNPLSTSPDTSFGLQTGPVPQKTSFPIVLHKRFPYLKQNRMTKREKIEEAKERKRVLELQSLQ